jgi:nucleoid-associated protein YgaU
MSEENATTEPAPTREWTKFIVLAVILVGVILVVALVRPLIFNRIVPAVMGEGQLTAPMPAVEPEKTVEEAYPPGEAYTSGETAPPEKAYPAGEEPPTPIIDEAYPAAEENAAGDTISYTVQRGDTILSISRHYGVSVEAIVAANNISNPNHIEVGTTLQIPK